MTLRLGGREVAMGMAALIWIVALHVGPLAEGVITDVPLYQQTAERIWSGEIPYRDFALEYPPLAALLVAVADVPGLRYGVVFSAFMLAALLATIAAVDGIARRLEVSGMRRSAALAAVALSPLLIGGLMETRYDLAVAAAIGGMIWAALAGRPVLAWSLLAAGVLLKLSPIVLAPALFLYLRGRGLGGWRGVGGAAGIVVAGFAPFLALGGGGVVDMFQFHLDRPLQIESTLSAYLLTLHALADIPIEVVSSFGSQGLAGPGVTFMTALSGVALVVLVGAVTLRYGVLLREVAAGRDGDRLFVVASAATLLAAIAGAKVLSPQFLIWLLPVIFLVTGRYGRVAFGLGIAAMAMTLAYFPARYWDLVALETSAITLLVVRDALILAALAAAWPRRRATAANGLSRPRPDG